MDVKGYIKASIDTKTKILNDEKILSTIKDKKRSPENRTSFIL